jgi:hypothetical protein
LGGTIKKRLDKNGGPMDRSHSDPQEDRSSELGLKHTTTSGQTSKKNVDKNGGAMDAHGHNGKASKVFVADSPDLPEHSDPLEKLTRLHIPRKLALQNLLKGWIVAHREGSRIPISDNLIFRGPRGKIPLL